jgi:hypothetical protein
MSKLIPMITVIALTICISACSSGTDASNAAAGGEASSTVTAGADGNGLVGTVWAMEDMTITFNDAPNFHVKGGMAGDGVNGTYSIEDEVVSVKVADLELGGTWDGTNLVVDGKVGKKIQ